MRFLAIFLACVVLSCGRGTTSPEDDPPFSDLSGEYLGQPKPGRSPQRFSPGIIQGELHSSMVFSPDGSEVFWKQMGADMRDLFTSKQIGGRWTEPRTVAFGSSNGSDNPFFGPTGDRLFFTENRSPAGVEKRIQESIWYVDRVGKGWSNPEPLPPSINRHNMHWQFSISDAGTLYFGWLDETGDVGDIFFAKKTADGYSDPTPMGEVINDPSVEVKELTPFIAPDESYLLFSRVNYTVSPYADLLVSFRETDGSWTTARPLEPLNSPSHELCPIVTEDGRFLFFISTREGDSQPYWVDATVIGEGRE